MPGSDLAYGFRRPIATMVANWDRRNNFPNLGRSGQDKWFLVLPWQNMGKSCRKKVVSLYIFFALQTADVSSHSGTLLWATEKIWANLKSSRKPNAGTLYYKEWKNLKDWITFGKTLGWKKDLMPEYNMSFPYLTKKGCLFLQSTFLKFENLNGLKQSLLKNYITWRFSNF
jgi:hypothetical protein